MVQVIVFPVKRFFYRIACLQQNAQNETLDTIISFSNVRINLNRATDPFVQANDWPETAAQRAAAADAAAQQPFYVYRHHFLEKQVYASDRSMVLFWCDLHSKKIYLTINKNVLTFTN